MVKYSETRLDCIFSALADPTRRGMLARLSGKDSLSVSKLAEPLAMSLPAVMKHLNVLSDAGLVTRRKTGRTVACRLNAAPMQQAMEWLNKYQQFWSERLDRLAAFLENNSSSENDSWRPSPASLSSATSRRRRKKSTAPGPIRKK